MNEWAVLVLTFLIFGVMFAMTVYRKKQNDDMATSFSWKNYTKPTPRNILRGAEFIQGTLLGISTLSVIMGNTTASIVINIAMVIINRAVMFFGDIVEDTKTESVTAEFPSGSEVTITHEKPKADTDNPPT